MAEEIPDDWSDPVGEIFFRFKFFRLFIFATICCLDDDSQCKTVTTVPVPLRSH
jgi:hypothetical protein